MLIATGAYAGGTGQTTAAAATAPPASSSTTASPPRWAWPVAPPRIVKGFAAPPTPYAAGHRGIDLAASPADTVIAPADGIVRFTGVVVDRPVLTIEHAEGVLSSYEPVTSLLEVGARVSRGTPVATTAEGGHCADSCIHVGARVDGRYVSPLLFFARVPASVLLPLGRGSG